MTLTTSDVECDYGVSLSGSSYTCGILPGIIPGVLPVGFGENGRPSTPTQTAKYLSGSIWDRDTQISKYQLNISWSSEPLYLCTPYVGNRHATWKCISNIQPYQQSRCMSVPIPTHPLLTCPVAQETYTPSPSKSGWYPTFVHVLQLCHSHDRKHDRLQFQHAFFTMQYICFIGFFFLLHILARQNWIKEND